MSRKWTNNKPFFYSKVVIKTVQFGTFSFETVKLATFSIKNFNFVSSIWNNLVCHFLIWNCQTRSFFIQRWQACYLFTRTYSVYHFYSLSLSRKNAFWIKTVKFEKWVWIDRCNPRQEIAFCLSFFIVGFYNFQHCKYFLDRE